MMYMTQFRLSEPAAGNKNKYPGRTALTLSMSRAR